MADLFKIRLWAVLGEGSTGKSTIIGGLVSQAGKGPGGFRYVPLRGGGRLELYVRRQSLQEAKRLPLQVVDETLKLVRDRQKRKRTSIGYVNLLFAIRTDSINGLPPGREYLSQFVQSGWSLESFVVLDYMEQKHLQYFDFGAPVCSLREASDLVRDRSKHHMLVGQARNHFGWA